MKVRSNLGLTGEITFYLGTRKDQIKGASVGLVKWFMQNLFLLVVKYSTQVKYKQTTHKAKPGTVFHCCCLFCFFLNSRCFCCDILELQFLINFLLHNKIQ